MSATGVIDVPSALAVGGIHPRPQLVRTAWQSLDGEWDVHLDPSGATAAPGTGPAHVEFDRRIVVPFAPETRASGLHETGPCALVWYRRTITANDVIEAGFSTDRPRVLLHFGAVDHHATVWCGGQRVGEHTGGGAPFTLDISDVVANGEEWELVVRAQDDPYDDETPRGKQDWHATPHGIWYERQTGIWQSVWLEAVPSAYIERLALLPDVRGRAVDVEVTVGGVAGSAGVPTRLAVDLELDGNRLGSVTVTGRGATLRARVPVPHLEHGQARDEVLWTPNTPRLVGATVRLTAQVGAAEVVDVVGSYTGLRDVTTESGRFVLNGEPVFVRAVLEQGYWPESGYTAPSVEALRTEVEAILRLGFNCARIHQKAEDPRFLFWADRLGLMIWAETPNAYGFGPRAVQTMARQWAELVLRDRSHPCVVTWVPINESWGVQDIRDDERQQAYTRALADLTRALDPTRPVVSNDGWEHTASDLWTIHDYEDDVELLASRYGSRDALLASLEDGPAGRPIRVGNGEGAAESRELTRSSRPFILSEFGGLRVADDSDAWGWSTVASTEAMESGLRAVIAAVGRKSALAGFCYTQLTDTLQEANGLLTAEREPKLGWDATRAAITEHTVR